MAKKSTNSTTSKRKSNNKKRLHATLIVSSVGALLIFAAIGLLAYLPGKLSTTAYDFLYTSEYAGSDVYTVVDGRVTEGVVPKYMYFEESADKPTLYRYDAETNTSVAISSEDAALLEVSDDEKSPDGYAVVVKYYDSYNQPVPFGVTYDDSGYEYRGFLRKGISNRPINLELYEYDAFNLVGWIVED